MIIRCKSCGMNIRYDITLGKLHCDHCGSNYSPEEYPDDSATFDACSYTCQSCGAKLITADDTEATAFCSFCGSTSILTERMACIKKPDAILPFAITKEQCQEIYLKQARKTFLVPRWLKSDQCVNAFRPIYMPYWTYSVHATGHVEGKKTEQKRDGDYIETTVSPYVSDEIDQDVAFWSHDASKAFADDISEMIGFQHVEEKLLKPFHEGYLSGFYADMAEKAAESHKRIARSEVRARLTTYGTSFNGSVNVTQHKLNYLPVWFMSTQHRGKVTYAAINGYNGKLVADFPISSRGFFLLAGIAAVILSILLSLAVVLRPEPAFWCSAALTIAGLVLCKLESDKLRDVVEEAGLSKTHSGNYNLRIALSGVLCLIFALRLLSKDNITIYTTVLIYAAILSYNCLRVFQVHHQLAQRRPPQFDRKGSKYDA